jgi:hypothetical protein
LRIDLRKRRGSIRLYNRTVSLWCGERPHRPCRQSAAAAELLRAREARAAGGLDHASLKRIEDEAIRAVIELQEAAGCEVVTDGEFRRESFQSELTASVQASRA